MTATNDVTPDAPAPEDQLEDTVVDLGEAVALTEGQGGGNSEDKRRAYNS